VTFNEIQVGQVLLLGDKRVEVLPAVHTVPACGFAISAGKAAGCSRETPSETLHSGDE
jgi:hypothetical protein